MNPDAAAFVPARESWGCRDDLIVLQTELWSMFQTGEITRQEYQTALVDSATATTAGCSNRQLKKKKRRRRKKTKKSTKPKKRSGAGRQKELDFPPLGDPSKKGKTSDKKTFKLWRTFSARRAAGITVTYEGRHLGERPVVVVTETNRPRKKPSFKRSKAKFYPLGAWTFRKPILCQEPGLSEEHGGRVDAEATILLALQDVSGLERPTDAEPEGRLEGAYEPRPHFPTTTTLYSSMDDRDLFDTATRLVGEDNAGELDRVLGVVSSRELRIDSWRVSGKPDCTILTLAILLDHLGSLTVLLDHGFGTDKRVKLRGNHRGAALPLHLCCANGREAPLGQLLKYKGVNIDGKDEKGNTPLHVCAQHDEAKCMYILLNAGAKPSPFNRMGHSPLHTAAKYNAAAVAAALVKVSAANITNSNGESPLHLACAWNAMAVARLLCQYGGDQLAVDANGESPLHKCCRHGHRDIVEYLCTKGALKRAMEATVVPARKAHGKTRKVVARLPLHAAAKHGHRGACEVLLRQGASVNAIDQRSCESPLFAACRHSADTPTVQLLIRHGADVGVQCGIKLKLSPLMAVLVRGGGDVGRLAAELVSAGANPRRGVGPKLEHPIAFLARGLGSIDDPVVHSLVFLLSAGVSLPNNFCGHFSPLDRGKVVAALQGDAETARSPTLASFMERLAAECARQKHDHHTDTILVAEDGAEFVCHRSVLQAKCAAMYTNMATCEDNWLPRDTLELLLTFVYTDRLAVDAACSVQAILDLMAVGESLEFKALVEACVTMLSAAGERDRATLESLVEVATQSGHERLLRALAEGRTVEEEEGVVDDDSDCRATAFLEKMLRDAQAPGAANDGSDLKVVVGASTFRCHAFVLAGRLEYFQNMLKHGMKESRGIVTFSDVETDGVIWQLLFFLYTGRLDRPSIDELTELFLLGDQLCYDDLVDYVLVQFVALLDAENAIRVMGILDAPKAPLAFRKYVYSFVLSELPAITKRNKDFLESGMKPHEFVFATFQCLLDEL